MTMKTTTLVLPILLAALCSPLLSAEERVHDLGNEAQNFRVHYDRGHKGILLVLCEANRGSECSRLSITGWTRAGGLAYEGRRRCDTNGGFPCFLDSRLSDSWAQRTFETGVYDVTVQRRHNPHRMGNDKHKLAVWMREQPNQVVEVSTSADSNRLAIRPLEGTNMTVDWVNPVSVMAENALRDSIGRLFGVTTPPPATTTSRWGRRRATTTPRPGRRH